MVLSKRLNILKEYVSKDLDCADIGADHGLLITSLANENDTNQYLGVENKIGPYNNLTNNINLLSKHNNVSAILSDGLELVSENFKSIVIAGMGSDLIIKIIKKSIHKILNINEFIIDAHNNILKILYFMNEIDFFLVKIDFLIEKGVGYFLLKFIKNNTSLTSKNMDLFLNFCKNNKKIIVYIKNKNYKKEIYYNDIDNTVLDQNILFVKLLERN